jgi:hypothetical protein
METVNRQTILNEYYKEILEKEAHHDHEIIYINGRLLWKPNPIVCELLQRIDLSRLVKLILDLGYDKNSEVYRKLYRDMGYSLSGYYEIFYDELNNTNVLQYNPKQL